MRTSAVTVAALTGLLAACSSATPETAHKDSAPAIPVEVATAKRGEMLARYSGTATLEAEADADVIALRDRIAAAHGVTPVGHRFQIFAMAGERRADANEGTRAGRNG